MKNYVKEYKGFQVPEGATHFTDELPYTASFYRKANHGWECILPNKHDRWDKSLLADNAIELPEATQEWMPEAGQECEVTGQWNDFERPVNLKDGQKVKILMDYKCPKTGTDGVIFTWIEGADNIRTEWTGNEKHFRPLKTQQEKDREAFIDAAVNEIETKAGLVAPDSCVFEILFDAGFTAPKDYK